MNQNCRQDSVVVVKLFWVAREVDWQFAVEWHIGNLDFNLLSSFWIRFSCPDAIQSSLASFNVVNCETRQRPRAFPCRSDQVVLWIHYWFFILGYRVVFKLQYGWTWHVLRNIDWWSRRWVVKTERRSGCKIDESFSLSCSIRQTYNRLYNVFWTRYP